jgi:hypothetical protein
LRDQNLVEVCQGTRVKKQLTWEREVSKIRKNANIFYGQFLRLDRPEGGDKCDFLASLFFHSCISTAVAFYYYKCSTPDMYCTLPTGS